MEILQVSPEEVEKVRSEFKIEESEIKKRVGEIKAWIKTEKHLPNIEDEDFLERILLRNKFRVDKTKQKIEGYCTLRGTYIHMYDNYKSVVPSQEETTNLALPKLTPNQERLIVMKLKFEEPTGQNLMSMIRNSLLLFEILTRNDYAIGERFVVDLTGHSALSLTVNPLNVSRFYTLYRGAYSGRFCGCDFINAPSFVTIILTILKALLPAKLFKRFKVHKDLSSLHKTVPKECLPKDFGGDLDSIENLISKWDKVFEHHHAIFEENFKSITNEKLRHKKATSVGVGTFKKLDID